MALQTQPRLTPEDYLALERSADFKSEYFDGEIFAMTGASEAHNVIAECADLTGVLRLHSIECELALAEIYDKVEF